MLPFMSQPAPHPACYVPRSGVPAQSQMFRGGQYLTRTPVTAGNKMTWTASLWVQRSRLSAYLALFSTANISADAGIVRFEPSENALFYDTGASLTTAAGLLRDLAWYHLVVVWDTGAAGADRMRLYITSARVAASSYTAPAAGFTGGRFNSAVEHFIGAYRDQFGGIIWPTEQLMADVVFVDGVALGPAAFGDFNIHGVWVPKPKAEIHAAIAAAGGWGVNGCHLDFSDPLQPGKDVSGKGNHWTAIGFDGTGKDTVASTPTNVYATLSPLWRGDGNANTPTVSGGGLEAIIPPVNSGVRGTMAAKGGKFWWYGRFTTLPNYCLVGVTRGGSGNAWVSGGVHYDNHLGDVFVDGVKVATWATWGSADTIAVALDLDAGTVAFYKSGVLQGTVTLPASDTGWAPIFSVSNSSTSAYVTVNFGQRDWGASPPPTGYKPLCTDNLPEPDIKDPAEAFTQATATGADVVAVLDAACAHWNGQWIEFIKRRDASEDWRVRFSDDPGNSWATSTTTAKGPVAALAAGGAYVGYRLRVGARYGVYTAEFDHATGTATTVSHGLNTARNVVIVTRVSVGGGDRYVWHPDLTPGKLLKLNAEAAETADGTLAAIGGSDFQIAATAPSGTYRVIVLAQRAGYLDLGKWAGTGAAGDGGPMAPMTIRPEWWLYKRINAACSWYANDAAREPVNPLTRSLYPNYPTAEVPQTTIGLADFVVGGVKVRANNTDINTSGGEYVYIAIGRPIGGVCVAPATAR